MTQKNNKRLKQIAFAVSLCLFVLWTVIGTGASLAWFNDTSNEIKNIFHIADFDVQLFRRLEVGVWDDDEVDADTELFNKDALYEPGYVEVVYLKVKNNGDVPFNWDTAVSVYDYVSGINYDGDEFDLQDYLRFGLVTADSETELDNLLKTREDAVAASNESLGYYSTQKMKLDPYTEKFMALIVRMPEEVTNVANYKPPHQPEVYLRVIVSASQIQN